MALTVVSSAHANSVSGQSYGRAEVKSRLSASNEGHTGDEIIHDRESLKILDRC